MATPIVITGAVEGIVDEVLLRKICSFAGTTLGQVYGTFGKQYIVARLAGYNNSARFRHWVVLLDLDQDARCAPDILPHWLPAPAPLMRLRVAVRESEAWILGDQERIAAFLGVPIRLIPADPEFIPHPKRELVNIAARSRRRAVREDMVPIPGGGQQIGPAYTSRLVEFITNADAGWRPEIAANSCDSLRRCIDAISDLSNQGFPTRPA